MQTAAVVHGEILPQRPEWLLSPQERAGIRDRFVREFESQYADWSSIAKVCLDVDRDRDWKVLGYHSYDAWLSAAAPRSRSFIYLVVSHYKKLSPDISDEELADIPLASATVLKSVSSKARRDPKVQKAAKGKAKELRETIMREHPDQHLEFVVRPKLKFSLSAWEKIETAYEAYLLVDPTASMEVFLEFAVSEV